MLKGYRTYASAIAIMLHQVLNQFGLADLTGEQVSTFIDVLFAILCLVFRYKATTGKENVTSG